MSYMDLAVKLLASAHPKEKRRPPTELERHEHVRDGTLRYLFEHDCQAAPGQLCEFFGFSQARLTKILTELEAEGLAVRRGDAADRRRVVVYLTDKGLEYAANKHALMLNNMAAMLEYLGPEDAEHLVRISVKLQEMQENHICKQGGCYAEDH